MEMDAMKALRREERITLALRALYEQYGFRKYRMGKFEEYELYTENKNFLKNPNIITFHDLDGRVLAMKPDVTLSIAKNTHATAQSSEKVYYLENVYWLEKQSGGYRETSQLGLEYIGRLGAMASFEVLCLAQKTLAAISENHRMQLSHIGFWIALLDGLGMQEAMRQEILSCLHGKRLHDLKALLEKGGAAPAAAEWVMKAAALCGPFEETLAGARRIALSAAMISALDELEKVYGLLRQAGCADGIVLDFSLVNDSDYYDGLIFQGYVEGIPRAIVAGGYYGKLMRKFGRDLDAIGFAAYVNELDLLFRGERGTEVDALVLYGPEDDLGLVLSQTQALRDKGLRVRAETAVPENVRIGTVYRYTHDGLKEAGENA